MQIFEAEIKNDRIKWIGKKPRNLIKTKPLRVNLQIIEGEENVPKNDLVEFFRNSPLYGIELDLERDKVLLNPNQPQKIKA